MQTTYLIANWKSNKTPKEAQIWTQEVKANLPPTLSPNITPVLCLPFIHLQSVKSQLPKFNYATQDLSPYPDGAYTGAVSARMLGDLVKYTLVGHSERRQYFHETPPQIARKVTQALEYNITPIVGVDKKNWHHQLNQFKQKKLKKIIIMYEPPEAIGSGTPAPPGRSYQSNKNNQTVSSPHSHSLRRQHRQQQYYSFPKRTPHRWSRSRWLKS